MSNYLTSSSTALSNPSLTPPTTSFLLDPISYVFFIGSSLVSIVGGYISKVLRDKYKRKIALDIAIEIINHSHHLKKFVAKSSLTINEFKEFSDYLGNEIKNRSLDSNLSSFAKKQHPELEDLSNTEIGFKALDYFSNKPLPLDNTDEILATLLPTLDKLLDEKLKRLKDGNQ